MQELPGSASNEIQLALPSNTDSHSISSDRLQDTNQHSASKESIIKSHCDDLNSIESCNSLRNDCIKEKLNENGRKIALRSELISVFRLMTSKILPNKSKKSRKKCRQRCPVMA